MIKYKSYAAYGSNMNLHQMKFRCPTAKLIVTGTIKGYELLFRGTNGSAVATIEPEAGSMVPVVLWKIAPKDEEKLDIYEGFPRLYRKEMVRVALDNGESIEAMVYVINYGKIAIPSLSYYRIIEEGYINNGINPSYLKRVVNKYSK